MPKQSSFSGSFEGNKYTVQVTLALYSWEENGVYFVYAPAMDLTGYGNTQAEADTSFGVVIDESIKYMEHKSTMFDELERLGWLINRKKKKVQAPDIETLLSENNELARIAKRPGVRLTDKSLAFALA